MIESTLTVEFDVQYDQTTFGAWATAGVNVPMPPITLRLRSRNGWSFFPLTSSMTSVRIPERTTGSLYALVVAPTGDNFRITVGGVQLNVSGPLVLTSTAGDDSCIEPGTTLTLAAHTGNPSGCIAFCEGEASTEYRVSRQGTIPNEDIR